MEKEIMRYLVSCVLLLSLLVPVAAQAADCGPAYADLKAIENDEAKLLERIGQYPECGKLAVKLGNIYYDKKMWVDADKYYEIALKLFPTSKFVQNRKFECDQNKPIALKEGKDPDIQGEVARRGLGGKKSLPPISLEVHFASGSAAIASEDYAVLDQFAQIVGNNYKNYTFEIQGHTDNDGTPAANQRLSERRAEAVKKYLEQQGKVQVPLTTKGFGESRPVASNLTDEGKAQNRRVEFRGKR